MKFCLASSMFFPLLNCESQRIREDFVVEFAEFSTSNKLTPEETNTGNQDSNNKSRKHSSEISKMNLFLVVNYLKLK